MKYVTHQQLLDFCFSHKRKIGFICLLSALIVHLCTFFTGSVSLGSDKLSGGVFYYIASFFGTAMILLICILLSQYQCKIISAIEWIGRNSFRFMALHNPIKGVIVILLAKLLHCSKSAVELNFMYSFIAFCITVLLCVALVHFLLFTFKKIHR